MANILAKVMLDQDLESSTVTSLTSGGTGAAGTSVKMARADHTHTLPAYPTLGSLGAAASSHAHGNITNLGAVGSASGLPLITGASGVVQAGSFGAAAGTFCQGNDSRLSDARTPTAHVHGNISNTGSVGSTTGLPLITGASGVVQAGSFGTAAGTFCQGNDSRLSDARTPTAHVIATNTALGAQHSISGATAGAVLRASAATAANFQRLVWADIDSKPSVFPPEDHSWSKITSGKPSSLSGYGITDGVKKIDSTGATLPDATGFAIGDIVLHRTAAGQPIVPYICIDNGV